MLYNQKPVMNNQNTYYNPVKKVKTADIIVHEIWNMILNGQLKPGDKLPNEKELMQNFQVSKGTLREALQLLESYGHITRKRGPNGGPVILDIVPDNGINLISKFLQIEKYSLDELITARLFIEPQIAFAAAENIDSKGIKQLKEKLARHEKDYIAKSCSRCGWEFYLLLAELSKNKILLVIEKILIRLLINIEFSLGISDLESVDDQKEYDKKIYTGQKEVAEAVINNEPEKARQSMIKLRNSWAEQILKISHQGGIKRTGNTSSIL